MTQGIRLFLILLLCTASLACRAPQPQYGVQPPPHPHELPFTQPLNGYHVRLEVDHLEEEMALIFEDISEKPVRLLRLTDIEGEVVLPDGTKEEVTFRAPGKVPYHKYLRRQLAGVYVARAEWLKTMPVFVLHVAIPLKGRDYLLTFDYQVSGGRIPFHRAVE